MVILFEWTVNSEEAKSMGGKRSTSNLPATSKNISPINRDESKSKNERTKRSSARKTAQIARKPLQPQLSRWNDNNNNISNNNNVRSSSINNKISSKGSSKVKSRRKEKAPSFPSSDRQNLHRSYSILNEKYEEERNETNTSVFDEDAGIELNSDEYSMKKSLFEFLCSASVTSEKDIPIDYSYHPICIEKASPEYKLIFSDFYDFWTNLYFQISERFKWITIIVTIEH